MACRGQIRSTAHHLTSVWERRGEVGLTGALFLLKSLQVHKGLGNRQVCRKSGVLLVSGSDVRNEWSVMPTLRRLARRQVLHLPRLAIPFIV